VLFASDYVASFDFGHNREISGASSYGMSWMWSRRTLPGAGPCYLDLDCDTQLSQLRRRLSVGRVFGLPQD